MSLNRTLQAYLKDFKSQFSITKYDQSKAFEFFVNYLIISRKCPNAISDISDLESLCVDRNGLYGIDAIAFLVNGTLILSKEDLKQSASNDQSLEVEIIFIQTKTEEQIELGSFLKTISAVQAFLTESETYNDKNKYIDNVVSIFNELYSPNYVKRFKKGSPYCSIYFVTAAPSNDDKLTQDIIVQQEQNLTNVCEDIKKISVEMLIASDISIFYREVSNSIPVDIHFEHRLELNDIPGVQTANIGYLYVKEYLKLITDEKGEIRKRIFYENVRDYQGSSNSVNIEIRNSVKNNPDKFVILNNGVTLITRTFSQKGGNHFELMDFQIVNGCQTSYEIFYQRDKIKDSCLVPIKVICTTDKKLITNIIRSTNRQTQVPDEAFITLTEYHKDIEDLFSSLSDEMPEKIFYERRDGEYFGESLKKYQKVTLHELIRDVTAVFFQDAYIVANNNPVNIYHNRKNQLFRNEHPKEMYYVASLLASMYVKNSYSVHKHIFHYMKYYVIMVARLLITHGDISKAITDTNATKKECEVIIKCVKSGNLDRVFDESFRIVNKVFNEFCNNHNYDYRDTKRSVPRNKEFNRMVLSYTNNCVSNFKEGRSE